MYDIEDLGQLPRTKFLLSKYFMFFRHSHNRADDGKIIDFQWVWYRNLVFDYVITRQIFDQFPRTLITRPPVECFHASERLLH